MSDRTIDATPQRRRNARREGRFPRSRELTVSAIGLLFLAAAYWRGATWLERAGALLTTSLGNAAGVSLDATEVPSITTGPLASTISAMTPILIVGLLAMFAIQLTQGGWVWLPDRCLPDFSRIGPARLNRLLSADRTIRALFALVKLAAGLAVMLGGIWSCRESLVASPLGSLRPSVAASAAAMLIIALAVIASVALLSAAEYAVRLSSYYRSLRMSAQELRDENRGRTAMRIESSLPAGDDVRQRPPASGGR